MTPMLTSHQEPQKRQWNGPIYLPKSICVPMNKESREALKKYNLEALQTFKNRTVHKTLCCLDDPTRNLGAEPEEEPLRSTQIIHRIIQYLISSTIKLQVIWNWSKHSKLIRP